jgi:acyl-CoA dehydrogenase
MGLADGPTEVHKITVARQVLREYQATLQIEREMRAQS